MNIVIVAEFCGDFSDTDNGRFIYLAKQLSEKYDVEIITSRFFHTNKCLRNEPVKEWPFKITFVDEPGYPKNICLRRFWSHYKWGRNVAAYIKDRKAPDVVYCAIPSLTGPYRLAKYCEKEHVRFVIDIQDLWPEAFQMVLNIPIISDIVFYPLKLIADAIYKRADEICAVSDTYCQRALKVNKRVKSATTVFLGTDLDVFDNYAVEKPVLDKKSGDIWLAYCGTLGSSYDLTCVIDALSMLDDPRLCFVVMGDGPRKEEFERYAKEKQVRAEYVGRLQYNAMCSLLKACDITVNPIAHNAAQSIINKHADYVASGLPIVSTQENEEFQKLVDEYQMGFNCKNNDSADLAEKIKRLVDDEKLRTQMGRNARRCAKEHFDRKNTYKNLINRILGDRGKS